MSMSDPRAAGPRRQGSDPVRGVYPNAPVAFTIVRRFDFGTRRKNCRKQPAQQGLDLCQGHARPDAAHVVLGQLRLSEQPVRQQQGQGDQHQPSELGRLARRERPACGVTG